MPFGANCASSRTAQAVPSISNGHDPTAGVGWQRGIQASTRNRTLKQKVGPGPEIHNRIPEATSDRL
jgi:hypothetical protein